jgi:TetR/AcrR family transcriptional regulator, fatty acid biosynthesis regulator
MSGMTAPANDQRAPRQRLDPETRRGLILDATAALVLSEGLTAVNMERIARDASVSKALVYSYFGNQTALLSELLLRAYRAFQRSSREAAKHVDGLEALVRATTCAYLEHVAVHGSLVQRLMMEPAIAARLQEVESADRMVTATFFADKIALERGVDADQAHLAAQLLMGLTGAAGDHLVSSGANAEDIAPLVVSMVMASLDGLAKR